MFAPNMLFVEALKWHLVLFSQLLLIELQPQTSDVPLFSGAVLCSLGKSLDGWTP